MIQRNMWLQREVILMGKFLGFKNWDRRAIRYWIDQGLFPEPFAEEKGIYNWYPNRGLANALIDISRRLKGQDPITDEDVEMVKRFVLEDNKVKNTTLLIKKIQERKGLSVCKICGEEDVRVNADGECFNCHTHKVFKSKKKGK